MRDNKPLELEALNHICGKIGKINLKYAHPNYDQNGGDIIIQKDIDENTFKYINAQFKGRNISSKNSSIVIKKSYVKDNFVLFVYLKIENDLNDYLYCFFSDDIINWNLNQNNYRLDISKHTIRDKTLDSFSFSNDRVQKLYSILDEQVEKHNLIIEYKKRDLIDNSINLWNITNSLPDSNLAEWLLDNIDFKNTYRYQDVFIACLAFMHSNELKSKAGIDYMFHSLSMHNSRLDGEISNIEIIDEFTNDWLVTYNKSKLQILKLNYNNNKHNALKLIFGDNEERIECLLIDNEELELNYIK